MFQPKYHFLMRPVSFRKCAGVVSQMRQYPFPQNAHWRCASTVARGETSGSHDHFKFARWNRAQNLCASATRNRFVDSRYQTFHVWLPATRRYRGEKSFLKCAGNRNPLAKRSSTIFRAFASADSAAVVRTRSGFSGGSYGSLIPVNSFNSPCRALA